MDEMMINRVWEKAIIVKGFDPNLFRKDICGAWIVRTEYNNRNSNFGWEIDHVYPKAKGGDDDLKNLRPMHWENNCSKGEDFPVYKVRVSSEGNRNVKVDKQYKVNDSLIEELTKLYD